jgi:hypothetical protein
MALISCTYCLALLSAADGHCVLSRVPQGLNTNPDIVLNALLLVFNQSLASNILPPLAKSPFPS